MKSQVKISVVSYTNSLPFVYGLQKADKLMEDTALSLDIPRVCAEKLLKGEVDLGLVPVAVIPKLKEFHIISDFCIAARGGVRSVMLYSHVPLNQVERIYMDYQSMTSVGLTRVLSKFYWNIQPSFIEAPEDYIEKIKSTTAGVVIGDRTFDENGKYPYEYDLSAQWLEYTGLPFVFAAWVSNKVLSTQFVNEFNMALSYGVNRKKAALSTLRPQLDNVATLEYLEKCIHFRFDAAKHKALQLYLQLLSRLPSV